MPGNDKVTLVRHDGSLMDATPEEASRLKILGYGEITPAQNMQRLAAESQADYYTSPNQQVATGLEGIANGLDFGISDYLMGDDETKKRAAYNPGLRAGTEAVGALLPLVLTGGESAAVTGIKAAEETGSLTRFARYAPTNLLSEGARLLAPESTFAGAAVRGAIEGGVYGGFGAADRAYLDGEPITAETVLHGIGWGAVIGGGLSLAGHAVQVGGEHAAAAQEAEIKASRPIPEGALRSTAGSEYSALKAEIDGLSSNLKQATIMADAGAKNAFDTVIEGGRAGAYDKFGEGAAKGSQNAFVSEAKAMSSLYEKAAKAAQKGNADAAAKAIEDYATHAKSVADRIGVKIADPAKALEDLVAMRRVQKIASAMPRDVEGFASMSPKRVEELSAALERAKSLPFQTAIPDAAEQFNKALGLTSDAADGGFRAAQKTARSILSSEGSVPKAPPKPSGPSILRKAVGYAAGGKAWLAAKATGFGRVGSYTAYRSVRDTVTYGGEHLAGIKAAALAGIREAAAAWGPGLGRAASEAGPKGVNALAYTLFGEPDRGTSDQQELAKRRVAEIAAFMPTAKDTIYKAVQPIAITQPMLAPIMHKQALWAIQAMQAMMPRDPGAISALKSLWKPGDVATQTLNKQLAVFHDPVGEAIQMLQSSKFDATKLAALEKIAPNIWEEFRSALLERVASPQVAGKMSANDQIFVSLATGIPVHSRMSPGQISTGQQIFMDRAAPIKGNPRIGPGGGLPNPSDNRNPGNATQAQRSTER